VFRGSKVSSIAGDALLLQWSRSNRGANHSISVLPLRVGSSRSPPSFTATSYRISSLHLHDALTKWFSAFPPAVVTLQFMQREPIRRLCRAQLHATVRCQRGLPHLAVLGQVAPEARSSMEIKPSHGRRSLEECRSRHRTRIAPR